MYMLIVGSEYGHVLEDGLSATHQEYRLARELRLPTLVCIKGADEFPREEKEAEFLEEIRADGQTYSRFQSINDLVKITRDRLIKHITSTFDTLPTTQQDAQAKESICSASMFERQPVGTIDLSALDMDLARQLVAAAEDKPVEKLNGDSVVEALVSRGYLWFDQNERTYRPSAAAVLLLARTPSKVFPQARLQLDAYAGDEKDASPVDAVFIDQPLSFAVEQAVAFILRNTRHPLEVQRLHRVRTDHYPQEALREALVNAVAHRDYQDAGVKVLVEVLSHHIVICNPGLPPGNQDIATISRGEGRSKARNPLVVQGLTWSGLMDERGSGIRRMREVMARQGLDAPRFSVADNGFTVTLSAPEKAASVHRSDRSVSRASEIINREGLSDRQRQIVAMIEEKGFVTSLDCVRSLGIVKNTAWHDLNDLLDKEVIEKSGVGKSTRYTLKSNANRTESNANRTQPDGVK